jgi:hypothetical protein
LVTKKFRSVTTACRSAFSPPPLHSFIAEEAWGGEKKAINWGGAAALMGAMDSFPLVGD